MHDKHSHWSDAASNQARDATDEDIAANLDGLVDSHVHVKVTKSGPLVLTDCTKCGRQVKGLFTWPEAILYYLGRFDDPIIKDRARPSKQGVLTRVGCNGGGGGSHDFMVIVEWDTVRQWIDAGIRSGCVKPEILRAPRGR